MVSHDLHFSKFEALTSLQVLICLMITVMAVRKIASSINVPDDWFGGDPCLPAGYPCTGIVCNDVNPSRVIMMYNC